MAHHQVPSCHLARPRAVEPPTKSVHVYQWQRRLVITLRITVTDEEVPKCMVHDDPHHNHTASARSVANSIIQEHQARTADAFSSPISEVWLFLPRDGGRYTNSDLVEELKNMDASVAVEPEVPTGIHVRFATLGSRIKPSDTVRHIVLDKSRFRLVWDPTMAFLVYDSVPALRGLLLDQAASLAPGEGRSLVTIHAHQPFKELQQWPHGLEFEDVHLETFLLRTKAAMPSLTPTQMFDAFVTDLSRWDVAIERMDLMGCPLGKTLDERAIRTSQLADIVGYDFSLAYFLSHITNQTSPAVRQAMIDIAAILAVGSDKHRSDFVTYRVEWATELLREGEVPQDHFINLDVNCAGIPDGITSQGAIWLALGIYRKLNGRTETDGPLVSEDGMFDIDTRTGMLIHLYAVEFDSQVTASQGVGSAQLSFEDVETVQREIWRCWFQYGMFRSGSQDEPTCYSVWPGQKTNTSTGVSEASVFDCFYNHDGQDGYWAISFGFLSMDNLKPQYLSSIPDFVVEEWLDERDVIVEELAVDHPFRR
ncbi:hypothetical protein BDP81DRAFT_48427 [Colletotrichum phormii]|uniref:Uncharacterized protein n=1 Tax=Colletotrichum phormii TaxID=359342 RepID=A0AAI9ZP80_9PEZI|nr:uncharacterized protein BDP81DRAFT_48427 [Colletotrichum phormii]KAK1635310.1 hypothetical protein BDP81DRAFT_48427 [Colletotrichum phormii]